MPALLDEDIARQIQAVAVKVHTLLGCFAYSRIDMILTQEKRIYVLELNSIPGLTPTSLLPKAAKQVGIDFKQLCLKLINTAYEKRKVRELSS